VRLAESNPSHQTVWPIPCPECGKDTYSGWQMEMHLRGHGRTKDEAATEMVTAVRGAQAC